VAWDPRFLPDESKAVVASRRAPAFVEIPFPSAGGSSVPLPSAELPGLIPRLSPTLLSSPILPNAPTAPDATTPPDDLNRSMLQRSLERSSQKLDTAAEAILADRGDSALGLPHPTWGTLTAYQWLRVAHVHCEHHLRIIEEIRAGALEADPAS